MPLGEGEGRAPGSTLEPLALGDGRSELDAGGIAGVELRDVDGRACGLEPGRTTEEDGEALGRLALGAGRLGAAEGLLGDAEGRLGAAEGRLALEPREPWNDDEGRDALEPREEEPEEPREGEAELPLDPRCASRTEEGRPPTRRSARPMVMGSRYFMGCLRSSLGRGACASTMPRRTPLMGRPRHPASATVHSRGQSG